MCERENKKKKKKQLTFLRFLALLLLLHALQDLLPPLIANVLRLGQIPPLDLLLPPPLLALAVATMALLAVAVIVTLHLLLQRLHNRIRVQRDELRWNLHGSRGEGLERNEEEGGWGREEGEGGGGMGFRWVEKRKQQTQLSHHRNHDASRPPVPCP